MNEELTALENENARLVFLLDAIADVVEDDEISYSDRCDSIYNILGLNEDV